MLKDADIKLWNRVAQYDFNHVDMLKARNIHGFVMSMVGPEWFQELSPNQLRTVDQLQCCILIDVKNNTITNVQENIGKLGLVLRPNHRHIRKALRLCCKDPVEFLLILYQIMNPKRKEYSLNDRLLLSAVVHLCMTETLRELHVRIPSPPVHKTVRIEKRKAEKKIKYESPYLEPLVFNPKSSKNGEDYGNPRIQYPESPYFSYLDSLTIDQEMMEDIFELDLSAFNPEDAELLADMRQAQLMYDRLWNGERIKLLKPTILKQCEDVTNFYKYFYGESPKSLTLPPLSTLDDSEDEECFCSQILEQEESDICCQHDIETCECEERCDCKRKSMIITSSKCRGCLSRERKKHVQRVIKGITVTVDNEVVPVIEATLLQKTCDCLEMYKNGIIAVKARNNLRCQKATYVISGVVVTKEGPVYIISTALKKTKRKVIINPNSLEDVVYQENFCSQKKVTPICGVKTKNDEEKKSGNSSEYSCKSKSISTKNSSQSCTCKKDTDDELEEDTSPCDCEECECRDRSKLYTGPRCKKCQEKEKQKYIERIITGMKETGSHKILPIIEGTRLLNTCDCLQNYAEKILSMEARNKIQSQKAQYVVTGVACTKTGPVYILSAALKGEKDCRKAKRKKRSCSRGRKRSASEEEETEEEDLKYSGCKCKEDLERFLNNTCTCEECNVIMRHEGITYVMGGTMSKSDKDAVNIVQGVYDQRCDCLERYKEKIDRLEEYRKRIEARYNLKSQCLKYSIGGVVTTPKGPVYVITGMRPPVDCECARAARRKEEEELHLQQMARMPPTGRIKYQISGVTQTPEGNVFIISQALAMDDCHCTKLYDTYIQAHRACLDMYEDFLKQSNEILEEYNMFEVADESPLVHLDDIPEFHDIWDGGKAVTEKQSSNSFSHYNLFDKGEVVRAIHKKCPGQKLKICSRGDVVTFSDESLLSECVCHEDEVENEELDESSTDSQTCANICLEDFKRNTAAVETEKEEIPVEEKVELKRFVVLEEIPGTLKKQTRLLKKVLATMAEDGFPLARLPDCYKLPHFKLWMQMRRGVFWRQKDINAHEGFSKKYWFHTDVCPVKVTIPTLGITGEKAGQLTWRDAKYVKKLVGDKVEMLYRHMGQKMVDSAREFFPLSFSYEFPNKTFRDVYFAYMPSKEKDTLAFHIVQPHDVRVISKKYKCYC